MRRAFFTLVLLLWPAAGWTWGQDRAKPKPELAKALAITHATVVDATGAPARPEQTVVIRDGRIAAIGRSAEVPVPLDAEVVEAAGQYVIPGLWDMHAHIAAVDRAGAQEYLSLFLANGVTGVREMHAYFADMILTLRDEIEAGKVTGPRIVAAGAMIDGPNPSAGGAIVAADAAQGRAAVISLKQRGVDFIKVHSKLSREAYFAIIDEAKKLALPVAGHVPEAVSAAEASDAGQRSIEHLTGLWISCSADEQRLREKATRELQSGQPGDVALLIRVGLKPTDRYSESKARSLYARFARNHTWQTPTLVLYRAICSLDDPRFTADPRLPLMPAWLRRLWDLKTPQSQALIKAAAGMKRSDLRSLEEVGKMHRAGVELLAGTDTPFLFCFPGFSLHDELYLLVEAGLTPMEALQTATRNPARYFGRLNELGTLEVGKLADLVVLEANPLADIKNTQRIAAVVTHGKLLRRDTLKKMLADVKRAP